MISSSAVGQKAGSKRLQTESGRRLKISLSGGNGFRGLEMAFALRGVGWAYQVKKIPPGKPRAYPHGKFVAENFAKAVRYFAPADVGEGPAIQTACSDKMDQSSTQKVHKPFAQTGKPRVSALLWNQERLNQHSGAPPFGLSDIYAASQIDSS